MTDAFPPIATGVRNLGFQRAQRARWLATRIPVVQHGEGIGIGQPKAADEPTDTWNVR